MANGIIEKIFSSVKSIAEIVFIGMISKINKPKNVKRNKIKRNSTNNRNEEEYYYGADESSDDYDDSSDD
jgi:hypothetical protein